MNQSPFRRVLFLGLLALSVFLCLALLRPFLTPMCWAAVLAVGIGPLYRRLAVRLRPSAAAALCCGVVFTAVLVPTVLAVTEIARESAVLSRQLPALAPNRNPGAQPTMTTPVEVVYRWITAAWERVPSEWRPTLHSAAQQAGSFAARQSMGLLKNLFRIAVEAGVTLLVLFFLLRDAPLLRASLRPFLPLPEQQAESLMRRVNDLIYGGLFGMVIVAVTQGVLDGAAFWIVGLPLPVLWGTALALASLVPFVGAPFVWVPASLYLAIQGQLGKAIAVAAWALALHLVTDHLLRPLFVGAYTRTHLLLTFFGVLGGLILLGPIGLFLGPVVLVVSLALLEMLPEEFADANASGANRLCESERRTDGC